jgi:hypothetical protein
MPHPDSGSGKTARIILLNRKTRRIEMTRVQLIRSFVKPLASVALLTVFLKAQPIMAQTPGQTPATTVATDKMAAIKIPEQPGAIELGTGPLPGATAPEAWHSQYGSMFARNVTSFRTRRRRPGRR